MNYNRRDEFQDHRTNYGHRDDRGWDRDSRAGTITKALRQRPLADPKGIASVRFADGTICKAEIHWYEAHGVGIREYKIKRILNE